MSNIDHITKNFEPNEVEERLYRQWETAGFFHTRIDPEKTPYTIVMPPPNITGQLHMGHALNNSLQDILTRWRRMQGYAALWVPGTDHASIATEAKIVEMLRGEGVEKEDIGRTEFLRRAWEWKEKYGDRINLQLRRLGCSCDWRRERFTMDEGLSDAVEEVFIRLYNKDLIYKGERIINWCPHCLTSISDAEVEYEEQHSNLWHIRYPYENGEGFIIVATTRPETMFGDTAVAVNPDDERYRDLIGQNVILPLLDKPIPIIADDYVDMDFGTGVVKITPGHDPNDFEVGQRHDLEIITVMTEDGHMNEFAGEYDGMPALECRQKTVEKLEELNLIDKIEPYTHNVGTCYRCDTTVDPRVSAQWFVRMKPLAQPAIDAVRSGETSFVPPRFSKTYFNWMENIRDWCISRQLWWGHQIPAYYCADCGRIEVGRTAPEFCADCGGGTFTRDEDTLDTWFSSALWPFSTLGWPAETPDLDYFYPTDTLVTSYDIIFFWVARMIFSALEQTGEVPFKDVYIHGIVRDAEGRKMSKSLGNGIDPLEIINHFGADALRYALVTGNAPGNDQRYQEEKLEAGRGFINKIWNAFRFVLMNLDSDADFSKLDESKLRLEDRWILSLLNRTVDEVTQNLERYELGVALSKIYNFIWDDFCDWYIEMIKSRLYDQEQGGDVTAQAVALQVLTAALKMLHPFMPFVTSEMYSHLPVINKKEDLMLEDWPVVDERRNDPLSERQISMIMEATRKIRTIRLEMSVPVKRKAPVLVLAEDPAVGELLVDSAPYLERLANVSSVRIAADERTIPENAIRVVMNTATLFIPMESLVDLTQERERLQKERLKLTGEIKRLEGKLSNQGFVNKAPEAVVQNERNKLAKAEATLVQIQEQLAKLS
ncbi:MAG: valine--tRNA ligase [Fastidiosipilaceae bacterium]